MSYPDWAPLTPENMAEADRVAQADDLLFGITDGGRGA
jgi:hypothetical protein